MIIITICSSGAVSFFVCFLFDDNADDDDAASAQTKKKAFIISSPRVVPEDFFDGTAADRAALARCVRAIGRYSGSLSPP